MTERRLIPVTSEPVGDCSECNPSACCLAGTALELTAPESERLRGAGSMLMEAVPPVNRFTVNAPNPVAVDSLGRLYIDPNNPTEPLRRGFGRYIMMAPCGNLRQDPLGRTSCADYNNRPEACETFEPGSDTCHRMQIKRDTQA